LSACRQPNFAKRLLDVVVAVLALAAMWPLFILLTLLIRRDSPGPALFAQPRLGLRRKIFGCYKFRTMYVSHNLHGPKPTDSTDSRVTRVGRWLRRTSLDELPQIINILRGEMSLVGPRPEQPFLLERYPEGGLRRFEVLPGLTGWWQVNGRPQPMYEHLSYDLYYVDHQSFGLDVWIIAMTVGAVLSGDGAI
jgi:lipopolysaccharide/colanic/teichoic acid biosynthesis glycosyltransferase